MAYVASYHSNVAPLSVVNGPAGKIQSWIRAMRQYFKRKQDLRYLLSLDERTLEDMGTSRADLIRELGHDPAAMKVPFGGGVHQLPHL